MNTNLRKTIVAGSVAALIAFPAWAAADTAQERSGTSPYPTSQAAPAGQTGGAAGQTGGGAPTAGAATSASNPLHARTADDVSDMDIVNVAGDKIGSIDAIVLSQDGSEAHAVVKVGGVMGVGARSVLVSLDELAPAADDELRIQATEDELKARPEFDKDQYTEIEGDQLIGESITQADSGAAGGAGSRNM